MAEGDHILRCDSLRGLCDVVGDSMKRIPYHHTHKAGFTLGIIYSAATLLLIQQGGAAEQLIKESGLSWKDLRKVKADPVDRELLRKIKNAFVGETP